MVAVIIQIVFPPINFFLLPDEIRRLYEADGQRSPVSAVWGLWILLPIIGIFSPFPLLLIVSRVWGLWILLPIIGDIVWYVKMQRSLNDFWYSKGATR